MRHLIFEVGTYLTRTNFFSFLINGAEAKDFPSKGTVGLTREGEVRWTSVSIFHGHERWKSEGVQVGGVRSARGVIGNWFDR